MNDPKPEQRNQPSAETAGLASRNYKEPELTLEAKQAVRSYVYKLVTPILAVSGVVLFFLGYFVRDIAEKSAYNDAFKLAANQVQQLSNDAFAAKLTATTASVEAQKSQKDANDSAATLRLLLTESQKVKDSLRTLEAALSQSEETVKRIADTLANRADFKKDLLAAADTRLRDCETRVSGLEGEIATKVTIGAMYRLRTDLKGDFVDGSVITGKAVGSSPLGLCSRSNITPGSNWTLVER